VKGILLNFTLLSREQDFIFVSKVLKDKEPENRVPWRSHQWDTNPRPDDYESSALPAELWWRFYSGRNYKRFTPFTQVFPFTHRLYAGDFHQCELQCFLTILVRLPHWAARIPEE
jgi:hypothetical protein